MPSRPPTKTAIGTSPRMGYVDAVLDRWARAPEHAPGPSSAFLHLGHFDEPPERLDAESLGRAQRRLNDVLLELAALEEGHAVVDVGCGVGATLAVIAERYAGMTLVGVNCDARQLEAARRAVSPAGSALRFVAADACDMPLESASYDRVLAVESIFHFPSRARFFEEAARILRPSGLLVLSDFVPSASLREAEGWHFPDFAVRAVLEDGFGPMPDLFGREGPMDALARAAGLELVRAIDATKNVMPSYDCLVRDGVDFGALDALDRAVATLRWLGLRGLLRMEYHVYRRART